MNESSSLGHLIDRQVSRWESTSRVPVEDRSVRETTGRLPEGPWIAISTQLGAGGAAFASALGERLGWRVFDKQIVEEIAKSTQTKEKVLSRLDGHAVGAVEDFVAHLFVPGHPGRSAYNLEMMRAVWAIAREGKAIMVGRGANWLLDPRYGLRVRAIAPTDKRVEWIERSRGLSATDALRQIEADNADRAKFVRQVFKQDIDDPLGYDVVVNLGALGLEPAVELVLAALSSKLRAAA
jgi:cytidylate kinase